MSVLVKDMQIPISCYYCGFTDTSFINCQALSQFRLLEDDCEERKPEWCPLVELPEHHGRLIDADRLMRVYEDRLEKVADRYGVDSSEAGILSGAMKLLMIELGIVEAEGDE